MPYHEDRRAHERIDKIEVFVKQHSADILRIEQSVIENTRLTKSIETNTSEIVTIMRGARGIMFLTTVVVKVGVAVAAVYALWHGFLMYVRGH